MHFILDCVSCWEILLNVDAQACQKMHERDTNYVENSSIYTAKGDEAYFIIGNLRYNNPGHDYFKDLLNKYSGVSIYFSIDDVSVVEIPFGIAGDTLLCPGQVATLSALTDWESYEWSTGDTNRTITINKPDKYWVRISGTCGSFTDTINVHEALPPEAFNIGNDTTICASVPFKLSAPKGNYTYQWSTGATTPNIIIENAGTYSCSVSNRCGKANSLPIKIDLKYGPAAAPVIIGNTDICQNEKLITTILSTTSAYRLMWRNGDTTESIKVDFPGYYRLSHYNECWAKSDSVYVSGCKGILDLPNAFTPNGDGSNDVFRPIFQDIYKVKEYTFIVVNRYGQEVFHSNNTSDTWNGIFRNLELETGTYYYLVNYSENGEKKFLKGDIMLLR